MNLIRKLDWFFKLEKRRYMIGILALSLVSVFNLIPPRVIGQVIDRIARRSLTAGELACMVCVMSGGSTSLEQQIIWDASYAFGFLSILRKCRQVFIKNTERVTSWHMRPMISMR